MVPADPAAGRVRAGSQADAAAGVDDGHRLLALAVRCVDPDPHGGGSVRRLVAGHRALGAVPRVLVWDGEGAIGRWRAGQVELTAECQAFRGTLGSEGGGAQAARAGAQGHHRAGPRLPGDLVPARPKLHRPGDFNAQLQQWLP